MSDAMKRLLYDTEAMQAIITNCRLLTYSLCDIGRPMKCALYTL